MRRDVCDLCPLLQSFIFATVEPKTHHVVNLIHT